MSARPARPIRYTILSGRIGTVAFVAAVVMMVAAAILGAFAGRTAPQWSSPDPGAAVRRQAAIQVPADAICQWKDHDAWQPQVIDCDAAGMVSRTIFALDREPVVYRLDTLRDPPPTRAPPPASAVPGGIIDSRSPSTG